MKGPSAWRVRLHLHTFHYSSVTYDLEHCFLKLHGVRRPLCGSFIALKYAPNIIFALDVVIEYDEIILKVNERYI